jgi:diaminopimelate epimerase
MISFEKYHGTGNDFIFTQMVPYPSQLAILLCDRHFGIGADGLMIASPSSIARIKMDYWNSDGSVAPMCGNGMRCFVKYVLKNNIVQEHVFDVETKAGIIHVEYHQHSDLVSVTMTDPIMVLQTPDVKHQGMFQHIEIELQSKKKAVSALFLGTLHAVVFVESGKTSEYVDFAEALGKHPAFPKQINVNLVEVQSNNTISVTTYERGAGWTKSCGTGACASAFQAFKDGLVSPSVNVFVPGGTLHVGVHESIVLTGEATWIASGVTNDV